MTRILLLGSEGQIGHGVKFVLDKHKIDYHPFDLKISGSHDLRIENNKILENAFQKSTHVIILAYDVGGSKYLKKHENSYDFIDNNIRIMSNVFALLKQYSLPFIFASSQMSNMNFSTYGLLKAVGERYTASLGGVSVKFWNVYGEEQHEEKNHVITDFIDSALKFNKIICKTDGFEKRQFLHANDAGEALLRILPQDRVPGKTNYDLTSFQETSIREIAVIIKEILMSKFSCEITLEFGKDKDNVQRDQRNEPSREILNLWKPSIDLENGILELIKSRVKELNDR
jgi:nucleoside-diphosphate-sugar epimerase